MTVLRKIWWVGHKVLIFIGIAAMIGVGVYIGRPPEKTGNQPDFIGSEQQQKKRLAVFLDGTWNSIGTNTNVWRMRALCASKGSDGTPQLIYYGLGVNGFIGGAFGQGLDENIRSAYEWLVENYNAGDEIFIFGFSRGAYTARALAGLIAIDGILKAGSPIGVTELFDRYRRVDEQTIWTLRDMEVAHSEKIDDQERLLLKYSQLAYVNFVGVWDTVGSIGIEAGDFTGISSSKFDYLQTGLRLPILSAYHALAIDEHRKKFVPTIWDVHRTDPTDIIRPPRRALTSVEQRWFAGAHANVGGGYPTDLLPQASLLWLMKKAESHGLTFRSEVQLDGDLLRSPVVDSYGPFLLGIYKIFEGAYYRPIGQPPQVRDDGAHINVNETIDVSVFDRWRKDPSYRPKNLVEWSQRKNVDPAGLQTSVRADDPNVQVADQ